MVIRDGLAILLPKVVAMLLFFALIYCCSMFYNRPYVLRHCLHLSFF